MGSGITPACAGNRYPATGTACASEDHPRVCGEQSRKFKNVDKEKGSPPRVRGTELFKGLGFIAKRITPACAGNSLPYTSI